MKIWKCYLSIDINGVTVQNLFKICCVVCESTPIIQLTSYLLDKNQSITFVGAMLYIQNKCQEPLFLHIYFPL